MMSSLLGEIHPEKLGSPGKWPLSRYCNKWKTNKDNKRWLNSRINMHKYKVEVVTLSPMKTVSKRERFMHCVLLQNVHAFCYRKIQNISALVGGVGVKLGERTTSLLLKTRIRDEL